MAKPKFVLTEDLVKVEPEPVTDFSRQLIQKHENKVNIENKERLSLNMNAALKKQLHLFCVHNRKKMTDIIEIALQEYLDKNDQQH